MKRSRSQQTVIDDDDTKSMANCLILLSGYSGGGESLNRMFECKTCNRRFTSFQALGGHRASHKKLRLTAAGDNPFSPLAKPRTHECSICGVEFAIGQALGGHMRRHRVAINDKQNIQPLPTSLSQNTNNGRKIWRVDLNLTPSENKFIFGAQGVQIKGPICTGIDLTCVQAYERDLGASNVGPIKAKIVHLSYAL